MSFEVDRRTGIKFKRVLKVGIMVGALVTGIVMGIILLITVLVSNNIHNKEITELEKKLTKQESQSGYKPQGGGEPAVDVLDSQNENWQLTLINGSNPVNLEYKPELIELQDGYEVDERIVDDARDMLDAAAKDGMNMIVCSAYRSHEQQKQIFNDTMSEWIADGYSYLDAYVETNKSVAFPGCSEHATGLALDIVSASYTALDEKQADTDEAKWLEANCWKYGFILRYPPEKFDITGIIYEPWHYRYVGKEYAKEIMEQGVTLEEYLGAVE